MKKQMISKHSSNDQSVEDVYNQIAPLIRQARTHIMRTIDTTMIQTYWNIGKFIVEEEQRGGARAEYGTELLRTLSKRLTKEFGKGFGVTTLEDIRKFYLVYSRPFQISHAVRGELETPIFQPNLSWTHYRLLMRLTRPEARNFYEIEASQNNWSSRALERQIDSLLFDRLAKSKDKEGLLKLAQQGHTPTTPEEALKEPVVLEFLNIPEAHQLTETKLEEALLNNLQHFLLELGKGFAFVSRQKRINLDGNNYYTDLVFYHTILKCYIIVDLKLKTLTHSDLGQMLFYVNYYDKEIITEGDNPTIGLVLCTKKSDAMVQYTLGEKSQKIFAKKYQFHLPTEEELTLELEREMKEIEKKLVETEKSS